MITSTYAINYIKNDIVSLIDNGKIKATYHQSQSTISFYVNDIVTPNRPLLTLTLRLSDHHTNLKKYISNSVPSSEDNTNLSIEFYQPLYDQNGKLVRNRVVTNVKTKDDEIILPFSVTYYEYNPQILETKDVEPIYKAILQWIKNNSRENTYNDPFKGTPKEAKTATKTAKIKTSFTNYAVYRDSVRYAQNRENGWGNTSQAEINWWKTKGMGDSRNRKGNLIENKQYKNNTNMKQRIKLTETDLHRIIKESVKRILNEYGEGNASQYMLGALAARKKEQGMKNGLTDNESGYNEVSKYAMDKRNGNQMRANSFYNGFHAGGNQKQREYGYKVMKDLDNNG